MFSVFRCFALVIAASFVSTTFAQAEDAALVVGNRTYKRASWIYGAESALNSAAALESLKYGVVSGRDLDAVALQNAVANFAPKAARAERAVVLLSGHFVHSQRDTWFLPADVHPPSLATVGAEGIALSTLLDILAEVPGGVAVFLGTADRPISLGAGLEAGVGTLDIPQGILVATGLPEDLDLTLRRDFLKSGVGFASALALAPESVKGQGFVSNLAGLLPQEATSPIDFDALAAEMREFGYWQAVEDLGTLEAYEAYLRAYPDGAHANLARSHLASVVVKTPEQVAAEEEAKLNLSRNARRRIQEALSLLGYDTRGIDGIFGRGTRTAISAWQHDQGFVSTGYLEAPQITRLDRQAEVRTAELAAEARRKQAELEAADRAFWHTSGADAGIEAGLRAYLFRYPDGLFADVAEARLEAIRQANENRVGVRERNAWEAAKNTDTIAAYEEYLGRFPNGAFADDARAAISRLQEEETRRAEIEAAKQEEEDMQMNVLARVLVEKQLNAISFDPGPADGNFDRQTRKAIRQFQRARGFPVTGYLTRQTLVRLIAEAR